MVDPTEELKTRAEILHKRIAAGDPEARARLRALAELKRADDAALAAAAAGVQRKHCLAIVAREAGFASWEHALRVLRGDPAERDFGDLLYDDRTSATLNAWYAEHGEARADLVARRARGEDVYLLAYRRQFFLAERDFVERLGFEPADPDWAKIGFDWARPRDMAARTRLYARRLDAVRRRA
jgi:hypothetical protein